MEDKIFIGKVGGEKCQFRSVLQKDIYCNCNDEYNPDCENCPLGKTIEEWAQKLEDNKDFQAIIDDKDVSYAEIAEVMIKALLGGEIK